MPQSSRSDDEEAGAGETLGDWAKEIDSADVVINAFVKVF